MKRKATGETVRAFCGAVYPQYTDLAMTMNGEEEMLQEATKLIRSRDSLLSLLREARDLLLNPCPEWTHRAIDTSARIDAVLKQEKEAEK